ncbi:MAG: hypothetical protein ABFS03_03965 [Chloroflexota bacterium]
MGVAWKFLVDIHRRGVDSIYTVDYGDFIYSAEWFLGFEEREKSVGARSWLTIVLHNPPASLKLNFLLGIHVRLQSVYGVTTRTHFTGTIWDIRCDDRVDTLEFRVFGWEWPLFEQRVSLPLSVNSEAGDLIDGVLNEVEFPARVRPWQLDVTALNNIIPVGLADTNPLTDLDVGVSTFPYVGDIWDNALGIDIIGDISSSEQGKFFCNRVGEMVFWDRDSLYENRTALIDLTDLAIGQVFRIDGGRYTRADVAAQGREVGTSVTVVWSIDEPIVIPANSEVSIVVRFRDDNNLPVAAFDVIEPLAVTDYLAQNLRGDDHTVGMRVSMVSLTSRGARLSLSHDRLRDLTVTFLQVRGKTLALSNPFNVTAIDYGRVALIGQRVLSIFLPLVGSVVEAEGIAGAAVGRYRAVVAAEATLWDSVTVSSEDTELALSTELFDRLRLDDDFTYVGDLVVRHTVVAEHHVIDSQNVHTVLFGLDVDYSSFMLVGDLLGSGDASFGRVIGH